MNRYTIAGAILVLVGGVLIQMSTGFDLFSAQYLKLWGSIAVYALGTILFLGNFD